jgi:geranyl diphosphate 2-C-methyltransferase
MLNPKDIARMYDAKTTKKNLNTLLAKYDGLFFNHNGLLLPGESMDDYSIKDEESLLSSLHIMEMNTVFYSSPVLNAKPGAVGLDAGCGAGGSGILISNMYKCRIEGFNISREQVKYANRIAARKNIEDQARFYVSDMMQLPVRDDRYDFIWACESTEHATSLDLMFKEWMRVGKDGGSLAIIAWIANDPLVKKLIDEDYQTNIHYIEEYFSAAEANSWNVFHHEDITGMTAPYWQMRARSINKTGAERYMTSGFSEGWVQYHILGFNLLK